MIRRFPARPRPTRAAMPTGPGRCPRTTSHVGRRTPWRVGWAGGLAVGLWHGRGGVGGGVVVFHAPAGPVDGDDVAVVEEAVEDGGGEDLVGEDLAPLAEGLVAGDDDGAFLVAAGDDLEDEIGVVAGQGEVAGFVDLSGVRTNFCSVFAGRHVRDGVRNVVRRC